MNGDHLSNGKENGHDNQAVEEEQERRWDDYIYGSVQQLP